MHSDEDISKAYLVLAEYYQATNDKNKAQETYKKALGSVRRTGNQYLEFSVIIS
jgi:Tfp pilus assembly protein PilF